MRLDGLTHSVVIKMVWLDVHQVWIIITSSVDVSSDVQTVALLQGLTVKLCSRAPSVMFQMRTVLSEPPLTTRWPSGNTATLNTIPSACPCHIVKKGVLRGEDASVCGNRTGA